ncbi:transcription factor Pcc1-domain-containing protein, partial [Powellomyces hirtus]
RTIRVPFPSQRLAEVAQKVLSVDREVKPNECSKEFTVEDAFLVVCIRAVSVRVLRTSASAFFDFVALVANTMEAFGDEVGATDASSANAQVTV